jgi:alpha-beta hydrolase superfamily lysophospholipase
MRLGRPLRVFGATFIVVSLTAFFGCESLQRKVLFYPTHDARDNGLARWTHDGRVIGLAREVESPENVWLLLHGNGGQAADRTYALPAFSPRDSVFVLEYPGYGRRAGKPSRRALDAAAREGYADLRERFPGIPVCVAAESIGSGPASMLARERPPPDKLVLIVPFDDLRSVGRDHLAFLPMSLLLAGTWNNVESLAAYRGPIDVFGARRDEIIRVSHAKALADSVRQARFHEIPGGHNEWSQQGEVSIRNP